MNSRQIAERDIEQELYEGALSLALPKRMLFDEEEFFNHYRDTVVDRVKEHKKYLHKKEETIQRIKPKR